MATRNGKIANLPSDTREQLNLRLLEGETGGELAAWLNALPEVQSVLGLQFNGIPISEVNLTHWRQGGYLQWLTERECFDSARALAEGDCGLARAGLTAERLLNILTLRFGQLLMHWDISPDESVSEAAAFSETARKARILQAISRSVLALHRIQSQSACSKAESARSSLDSPAGANGKPFQQTQGPEPVDGVLAAGMEKADVNGKPFLPRHQSPEPTEGRSRNLGPESIERGAASLGLFRAPRGCAGARPEILSGPISLSSILLNLSQTPFKAGADLAEVLKAV